LYKLFISTTLLLALGLAGSGCAKSSDVEAISSRVSVLETKVSALEVDIAGAKAAAADAALKANAAEVAASRAADISEQINKKVNAIFKQNCTEDCG
jgi:murein lipoprotein